MNEKDHISTDEAAQSNDSFFGESAAVRRFSPEQMNSCPTCRRANPPTRLACFYCGAELEITEKNQSFARPAFRKLETWEKGFNVICLPSPAAAQKTNLPETATFLRLEIKDLERILAAQSPLPLARVESAAEAEIVRGQLEKTGLSIAVVSDAQLEMDKQPRRVRALEFADDSLVLQIGGKDNSLRLAYEDLRIAVAGSIFRRRREESERRTRSGGAKKVGEATEFSADERILDFYHANDAVGSRIVAGGFDFSCLGSRKTLLARENFNVLLDELRRRAPHAPVDETYPKMRQLLDPVWSVDERRESAGWKHRGVGKINVESVTTASNEMQFNRYSRMLAHLAQ